MALLLQNSHQETYGNETDTGMASDADNLPETASEMPLVALIGLLSLAGAVIIRVVR